MTGANLVQVLMVAGLFGMFFLGVLYLQRVLRFDPIETGLAFLPVSLTIGVLSLSCLAEAQPAVRREGDPAPRPRPSSPASRCSRARRSTAPTW